MVPRSSSVWSVSRNSEKQRVIGLAGSARFAPGVHACASRRRIGVGHVNLHETQFLSHGIAFGLPARTHDAVGGNSIAPVRFAQRPLFQRVVDKTVAHARHEGTAGFQDFGHEKAVRRIEREISPVGDVEPPGAQAPSYLVDLVRLAVGQRRLLGGSREQIQLGMQFDGAVLVVAPQRPDHLGQRMDEPCHSACRRPRWGACRGLAGARAAQ
jgi:hypothetical protein